MAGPDRGVHVVGRTDGDGPVAHIGAYLARDGSRGARVGLDLAGPHVAAVVGKRGSGKSHTLGVLAEELATTTGVVPLVIDPMGAVGPVPDARRPDPTVAAAALPPAAWPALLDVDPARGPGALVWRAAAERTTLPGMRAFVADADVARPARIAARNHFDLAASWGVFDPDGLTGAAGESTVLDLVGLSDRAANAVARAVVAGLYDARVDRAEGPLPWLLVDEASMFLSGVAAPALRRVITRGRAPGVSLVLATQRPADLPEVVLTQADLLVAHELSGADRRRFVDARSELLAEATDARTPRRPGQALLVDDASSAVHALTVRERRTEHGGTAPRLTAPDAGAGSAGGS